MGYQHIYHYYETNSDVKIDAESVDYNTTFTKPTDPEKEGYTFKGWYTDNTFSTLYDFDTPATKDITVYADWAINTYTITYDTDSDVIIDAESVDYNTPFTKPTDPKKEGYTFKGWYTDNTFTTLYDFDTPATKDIIVYADWNKNEVPTEPTDPNLPDVPTEPTDPSLPGTGIESSRQGYYIAISGFLIIVIGILERRLKEE